MVEQKGPATTVVCVGASSGKVRGVCANVRKSGYRAIAVITEINPEVTLPLLSTLSPDAIIVSDDLPNGNAKGFRESLRRLYPDIRILLLAEDHDPLKGASDVNLGSNLERDQETVKLMALLNAHTGRPPS